MAPVTLIAVVLLVAFAPTGPTTRASVLFAGAILLNLSASAALHRGRWSATSERVLTRLDHATIFLVIAAAYTSVATQFLRGQDRTTVLVIVWTGAAVGMISRLAWEHPPRSLRVGAYLGLATAPILWLTDITRSARPEVLVLLGSAGLLYLMGAVVYAVRRPNPVPTWYGFHEVFHTLIVLAFAAQLAALSFAVPALGPVAAG